MKKKKTLAVALTALLFVVSHSVPISAQNLPPSQEKAMTSDGAAFRPELKNPFQNYMVEATLAESNLDTSLVQPLYSLDGEAWQDCGDAWDVCPFDGKYKFRLYANCEPLEGYLKGKLNRFYLKLRITRENGTTYETQPAVIDRGDPRPIPENISASAAFSPDMAVIKTKPFDYYGGYQITVGEHATAEEISAYLPDTLPVKISLAKEKKSYAEGIVSCPVRWKPLTLPRLTAGESVTIEDAAEEITVPKGTRVTTPMGIFELNEALPLDEPSDNNPHPLTDEVRLTFNVISQAENPTGVLSEERAGLEMAFHFKPTGATAIHAYTYSEGDSRWTEIPGLSLLEAVNAHPSAKNSHYALVIPSTLEPYRSYLKAQAAGNQPAPFLVGLKIEGGIYAGKQLVLPWPATYDAPVKLPDMGGSGGNYNNAGTDNKNDSTESGQRPNLPYTPDHKTQATARPYHAQKNSQNTSKDRDGKNHTSSRSKKNTTANGQNSTLTAYSESAPQTTATPNQRRYGPPQNFPRHSASMPNTPARPNMQGTPPQRQASANQSGNQTSPGYGSASQSPAASQPQADTYAMGGYPDSATSTAGGYPGPPTSAMGSSLVKLASPALLPLKARASDAWKESLLSATVMAVIGLCLTGVGKFHGKP